MDRQYQQKVGALLESFHIQTFTFTAGRKHPTLMFRHGGRDHKIVIPGTASDHRSLKNNFSFIKRYLRTLNDQQTIH